MGAGDDDVDLAGPLAQRVIDFGETLLERRQAGGKAGGDRGDRDAGAGERLDGGRDHRGIDADRGDGRRRVAEAERCEDVLVERLSRLGAQAMHPSRRVVAGERRQIEAAQRPDQPRGLIFLLDRAPGGKARRAPLDGAGVDPDGLEPRDVEGDAGIARAVVPGGRERLRTMAGLVHAPHSPAPLALALLHS